MTLPDSLPHRLPNARVFSALLGSSSCARAAGFALALLLFTLAQSASALSSTATIDLILPDGTVEEIELTGTSTLSITSGIMAPVGLDLFQIELASLMLAGESSILGALTMTLAGMPASEGAVQELSNGTPGVIEYPADSRIDAYFILDFVDFAPLPLHNGSPVILTAVISGFPPPMGETYNSSAPVSLLDPDGLATGFALGPVAYTPIPEPGAATLLALGGLCLFARHWRGRADHPQAAGGQGVGTTRACEREGERLTRRRDRDRGQPVRVCVECATGPS